MFLNITKTTAKEYYVHSSQRKNNIDNILSKVLTQVEDYLQGILKAKCVLSAIPLSPLRGPGLLAMDPNTPLPYKLQYFTEQEH